VVDGLFLLYLVKTIRRRRSAKRKVAFGRNPVNARMNDARWETFAVRLSKKNDL
jgi:hypothetical protein